MAGHLTLLRGNENHIRGYNLVFVLLFVWYELWSLLVSRGRAQISILVIFILQICCFFIFHVQLATKIQSSLASLHAHFPDVRDLTNLLAHVELQIVVYIYTHIHIYIYIYINMYIYICELVHQIE